MSDALLIIIIVMLGGALAILLAIRDGIYTLIALQSERRGWKSKDE